MSKLFDDLAMRIREFARYFLACELVSTRQFRIFIDVHVSRLAGLLVRTPRLASSSPAIADFQVPSFW